MGRGLFSGIVWGIVVTGLGLVVLALVGPAPTGPGEAPAPQMAARPEAPDQGTLMPEAAPPVPSGGPASTGRPAVPAPLGGPATDIELPPGSEFNRPPPERAASLPDAEAEPRGAPPVRGPEPGDLMAEAPLPDTAPSAAPEPVTDGPDGLAPPLTAEAPPDLGAEEPFVPAPGADAPAALRSAPGPAAESRRETQTAQAADAAPGSPAPQPDLPETVTDPAPAPRMDTAAARTADTAPPVEPERAAPVAQSSDDGGPGVAEQPRVRPLPGLPADAPTQDTAEDPSDVAGETGLRVPAPGATVGTTDIRIGRLPTVNEAAPEPPAAAEVVTAAPAESAQAADAPAEEPAIALGALARNAVPFQTESDRPLFSVILIDAGEQGLDRETLMTFSFPVTFAVDPTRPDAAEAMAAYRAAGYEVVALASALPAGAVPSDLEVVLTAQRALLDRAVAVLDVASGGFQDDRALTAQMVAFAGETGHGLVTYDRGLNSAARLAGQAGVPQATVFRVIDDDRPNAPTIRRVLDRAVFKARQDGHVVMVGHSYSDTVTALYSWALEAEAEQVTLAPVSAVLRQP
ncbi:polysaccharide deacteylase family 2 protein [Rhodovulum marinum]|uniref:Polysaccharide deacetylase 2 family uncharacterized protein YibQ n=1 Tax=Rhodovulum marinum TaxID=320662 RepID=A0A4V2SRH0_9RHOB|nr:polysaccharide deacteylase family 2 protein [Rhodovulum marinum]TCP42876.1 polysaccharide deacetylase 2 family uncharacterized protein YibQ [Rhodovulum marinum]